MQHSDEIVRPASRRAAPAPAAPPPKRLSRAPFVHAFREILARRGAETLRILATQGPGALRCLPCVEAAAAALGLGVERLLPLPEERQVLTVYDQVNWRFADQDDDDEVVVVAAEGAAGVAFREVGRFGLFQITGLEPGSDELLYLWVHEQGEYDNDDVILATRHHRTFERLTSEAETRHRIHERERPGLVVIGEKCERRSAAEPLTWDDVLLPRGLRDEIERTVREFFTSRELYKRHGLAYRRGLLLAGPPGNGKTTVLKAIRTTAGVPVVVALGSSEGGRGELVARAFDRAAELAPAVLCFEDLDALVDDGPVLSQFLNRLDGLAPLEGVLVVATTNCPDRIDAAIAKRPSRFDRVFKIPPPDRERRRAYLAKALGADAPEGAADRYAAKTEGYSVAFLKELVVQARFAALRRADETIREDDLVAALDHVSEHVKLAARDLGDRGTIGFGASDSGELD